MGVFTALGAIVGVTTAGDWDCEIICIGTESSVERLTIATGLMDDTFNGSSVLCGDIRG